MNWFRRVETRFDGRKEPGTVLALRAAIVVIAIADAYHDSLLTLIRNLAADTPLAYLGLVPFIALGLAVIKARQRQWEPDVHDRYVDYIVGLPLILVALAVVLIGPVLLSSFYWSWRLDLLTLPLFAAGAVTLVFGLRATARLKLPIAFLFLAWPLPYTLFLGDLLNTFTDTTTAALRGVVSVLPVARPVDLGDGSLFTVANASQPFVVSVGSLCAGANGAVGFLLVGGAMLGLVRGRFLAKAAWLSVGIALTWLLNLVRIMGIFAAGSAWGEDFAINALHPFFGLITFNIGVLAMVLALPTFRLRLSPLSRSGGTDSPTPTGRLALPRLAIQRSALALCVVLGAGLVVGSATGDRAHLLVTEDLGQPRLTAFSPAAASVAGWTPSLTDSYPWVQQFFGQGATWNRYMYLANSAHANGDPPAYVTVDVISTYDLNSFATYGLEACYGFHNYRVLETDRADLGGGVVGKSIVYYNPSTNVSWSALYWEWPVQLFGQERYERIVLNATATGAVTIPTLPGFGDPLSQLQLALAGLLGGNSGTISDPQLVETHQLLLGFARALVNSRGQSALAGSLP